MQEFLWSLAGQGLVHIRSAEHASARFAPSKRKEPWWQIVPLLTEAVFWQQIAAGQ